MQADLLVGADGVHSTVRKAVFGNSEDSAFRYLGMQTAAFIFEDAGIRDRLDCVKLLTVPGRQIGFYPIREWRLALRNLTLKLMRVPGLNRLMLRSVASGADI